MDYTWNSCACGLVAALFFGMSKTGVPGLSIPGVLLMAMAFSGWEKLSTGAVVPLLVLGDLFAVWYYRRGTDWTRIGTLLPSIYLGLAAGTFVLWSINHSQFKTLLALLILILVSFEGIRRWLKWDAIPQTRWFAWTMGLLTGFTTQIGNAAGPVMSVYMTAQNMDKTKFMGTWAVFFLIINLSKLPLLGGLIPGLQMITPETLLFDLFLLPGLLLGVLLGRKIYLWIPEPYFVPSVMILNLLVPLQMLFL